MLSHNKLVVGVPVYNESLYIQATLDSLASQSQQDFLVLISDNNSDDGSSEICRNFLERHPKFAYYKHETNIGSSANFQYLLENTDSTYFMWLGGHDIIDKNYIETQLDTLESDPNIALAYSRTTWIDGLGNTIRESDGGKFVHNLDNPLERYLRAAKGPWQECTAVNGIFRRSALRGVKFFSFAGPDHYILTRTQFFGRFYRTERPIYFRREFSSIRSSYIERISGKYSDHSADNSISMLPLAIEQIKDYFSLEINPLKKILSFPRLLVSFEVAYQLYTNPIKNGLIRAITPIVPASVRRAVSAQLRSLFAKH
jgi:glycosyltransferase involved in cell wall biosynthesis